MKSNDKKSFILPLLLIIATLFLGIGYATVNSITLDIEGTVVALPPSGVFITEAVSSDGGIVDLFEQSVLSSQITLSNSDLTSTQSFQITVFNNSEDTYYFDMAKYTISATTYSNPNIDFTLSGITQGYELAPQNSATFTVTFKYSDTYKLSATAPYENTLSSYINFDFVTNLVTHFTVSYDGLDNLTSLPLTADLNQPLEITFPEAVTIIKVTMGGVTLISSDYTFSNNKLTISNVTGDIVVMGVEYDDIEYVFTPGEDPITRDFTEAGQNITTLTQFYEAAHVHAATGGDEFITGIDIDLTYKVPNGNVKIVSCTLTVDGDVVETKERLTFEKNGTSMKIQFTGLNIAPASIIQIEFAEVSANNGSVTVTSEKITLHYD